MTRPVCLITGASSGIGRGLCQKFAQNGYDIVALARRKKDIDQWVSESEFSEAQIASFYCDVTDSESVNTVLNEVLARFHSLDCVVLNAGVSISCPIDDFSSEKIDLCYQTNVLGNARILEKILPVITQQRYGHIVGISSLSAYRGLPGHAAYCSSKAAFSSMLDSIRVELHSFPTIHVSTIHPGFIETPLTKKNQFRMPFLMTLDQGVDTIYRSIMKKHRIVAFPFWMGLGARILRILPVSVFDWLLQNHTVRKSD